MFNKIQLTVFTLLVFVCCVVIFPIRKSLKSQWIFSLIKTIYQRVSTKPLPNDAKSPLPVDVRRSKTPLLKLPTIVTGWFDSFLVTVRQIL